MNYDWIPTIAICIVALFAIQGFTIFAVVKLLTTGRAIFERKAEHDNVRRILG